jgi:hypothetical protein
MGKPSCSAVQLGRKDKPWPVWLEPLLSIGTCFRIKTILLKNMVQKLQKKGNQLFYSVGTTPSR